MKIAFFNYLKIENGGGAERFISNAAFGLKKIHPELKISIVTYEFVKNISKLRNILKEYDVVYSRHDLREAIILKFLVGYKNLKKVIFGFHTSIYFGLPPAWQITLLKFLYGFLNYKFLLNGAGKFHVVNSFAEAELKHIFKNKDVVKIYNPFDFNRFESYAQRNKKQLRRNKNKLNLLWVGRLNKEKGADDLIKLIQIINKTNFSMEFVWNIVGVGELEEEIKILADNFNNINYLGYINNQDLAKIYKENDMFLATSRWESFPYTFLEAQTFGLPIISYDIHGCNEIVKEGVNGYLVNSIEDYGDKLIYLIKNKKEIIKKETVKRKIRELVDSEEIFKKLYDLLQ